MAECRTSLSWHEPLTPEEAWAYGEQEFMRRWLSGELPPPPMIVTLNMTLADVGEGQAVLTAIPRAHHYAHTGHVHAGMASAMIGTATGCALNSRLSAGHRYTANSQSAQFVGGIQDMGDQRDLGRIRNRVSATSDEQEDSSGMRWHPELANVYGNKTSHVKNAET